MDSRAAAGAQGAARSLGEVGARRSPGTGLGGAEAGAARLVRVPSAAGPVVLCSARGLRLPPAPSSRRAATTPGAAGLSPALSCGRRAGPPHGRLR